MGFGLIDPKYRLQEPAKRPGEVSVELLHRAECNACPLNTALNLRHPKMEPTGSTEPDIYMLGEAPGEDEDHTGKQFVGKAGRCLRLRIPDKWLPRIRWNNVIRTRPPKNRDPAFAEIECCRPSIQRDIAWSEPLAIFGFGNVPLKWALNESRITQWSGRRAPVNIAGYPVWYFAMAHPSWIIDSRRFAPRDSRSWGSDDEFGFAIHMRNAFRQIEAGLPKPIVHTPTMAREGIEVIDGSRGDEDCERIIRLLKDCADNPGDKGIDLETDRLRPYAKSAIILTASVSTDELTFAFPLRHREASWSPRQLKRLEDALLDFLIHARGRKIAHQLAFEMEWFAEFFGRQVLYDGEWHDSQAQAYVLDERLDQCLSLDFLCVQYFGLHIKGLSNLNRKAMGNEPLAAILPYNGLDSKYCRLLFGAQALRIKAEGLQAQYDHHLTRIPAIVLTQRKGVPVDQIIAKELADKYGGQADDIEDEIMDTKAAAAYKRRFNQPFNVSSNKDVMAMFNQVLGQPIEKSEEKILAQVDHPLAKLILDWRGAWKSYATYCLPLLKGSPTLHEDGLLHPILSTMKAKTWRTASEEPNSQNFPKYTDGADIRKAIRREGYKVCAFDYGSIQARNVAMESKDRKLVKHFWDRYDIHDDWLERLMRIYPSFAKASELKDKDTHARFRHKTKNKFVFPSFFGAKPKSISIGLGVPIPKVERLQEEFWNEFPEIFDWHQKLIASFHKHGYVAGHSGFRRRAPVELNQLINAPIQADESIIVLSAMAAIAELERWELQPNLEVHDDLTFIWPAKDVDRNAEIVLREMTKVRFDWINVPLLVEMSIGDDWYKLEKIGNFESDIWDGNFKRKVET